MKRQGNLFEKIIARKNVEEAFDLFLKTKAKNKPSIKTIIKYRESIIDKIIEDLSNETYVISRYNEFIVNERTKTRIIQSLQYYDRIAMTAIINVIGSYINDSLILDTYSAIKGKGLHLGLKRVKKALLDIENTKYCLKLDLKHYYENVDQDILYSQMERKFKDKKVLRLLKMIIHSYKKGISIGYHSSQYFGNYYLSCFDHYVKETLRVKYYYRYCDDIVIFAKSKDELHEIFNKIKNYLNNKLNLSIKSNYQIFHVDSRGVDFLGYKMTHNKIMLRKAIKTRALRHLLKCKSEKRLIKLIGSFYGWSKHCSSKKLLYKTIKTNKKIYKVARHMRLKDLNLKQDDKIDGKKVYNVPSYQLSSLNNIEIQIIDYEKNVKTKYGEDRTVVHFGIVERDPNNIETIHIIKEGKFFTSSQKIRGILDTAKAQNCLPFETTIKRNTESKNLFYYLD